MRHLEDAITISYFAQVKIDFPDILIYHVPNGGKRDIKTAVRFKAMGVCPGIPDIQIDAPAGSYGGMRIELKSNSKKKPTAEQLTVHGQLELANFKVLVCCSAHDALLATAKYLQFHIRGNVREAALCVIKRLEKR